MCSKSHLEWLSRVDVHERLTPLDAVLSAASEDESRAVLRVRVPCRVANVHRQLLQRVHAEHLIPEAQTALRR